MKAIPTTLALLLVAGSLSAVAPKTKGQAATFEGWIDLPDSGPIMVIPTGERKLAYSIHPLVFADATLEKTTLAMSKQDRQRVKVVGMSATSGGRDYILVLSIEPVKK